MSPRNWIWVVEGILAKLLSSSLWCETLHVFVLLPTLEEFEVASFGAEEALGGWSEAGAVFLFLCWYIYLSRHSPLIYISLADYTWHNKDRK